MIQLIAQAAGLDTRAAMAPRPAHSVIASFGFRSTLS